MASSKHLSSYVVKTHFNLLIGMRCEALRTLAQAINMVKAALLIGQVNNNTNSRNFELRINLVHQPNRVDGQVFPVRIYNKIAV